MPRLEGLKDGLDTLNVVVAVLSVDRVQLSLENGRVGALLVGESVSSSGVLLEVSHVELDVLGGKSLLVLLELDELLGVDDGSTSTPSTSTSSTARRERDTGTLSVGGNDRVEPGLGLALRSESLGGLHGDTEEDGGVGTGRSETPGLGDVGLGGRDVETSRHLTTNHPRDERRGALADGARVAEAQSGAELVERELLTLLRGGAELELKVSTLR